MYLAGELGDEPGLAHPAPSRNEHEPTRPAVRPPPLLAQSVEIGLPTRERRAGVELER
jgi:hypothetical protein